MHRKTLVAEPHLHTLAQQVFSCEFCEISKNTFSYRTPPVAASGHSKICPKHYLLMIAIESFRYFKTLTDERSHTSDYI